MEREPRRLVYDIETESFVSELYEGDRIIRDSSAVRLQTTTLINNKDKFCKIYDKCLDVLTELLSGNELKLLMQLLPYMSYESGIIKHRNGAFMERLGVAKLSKQSISSIDRALSNLMEQEILCRAKVGKKVAYIINPFIFLRGTRFNNTLLDLFKNTKWAKM